VEFLLADQQRQTNGAELVEFSTTVFGSPFAATLLESPDAPSVYRGPPLSLEHHQFLGINRAVAAVRERED